MVKGESRYFTLSPVNGESLHDYLCRYEIKNGQNKVIKEGVVEFVDDNEDAFAVKVQTTDIEIGVYMLHVFMTDPSDGYVQVYSEELAIS